MRWRLIHIPRTGGTAFAKVYSRGTEHGHEHAPAREFDEQVLTFAFIRDPRDRAISLFGYILGMSFPKGIPPETRKNWELDGSPTFESSDMVRWALSGWPTRGIQAGDLDFLTPQVDFIRSDTILLRYDDFINESNKIARRLALEPKYLPRVNDTLGRPKQINGRAEELVRERWAADFEQLSGYWT